MIKSSRSKQTRRQNQLLAKTIV